LWLGFKAQTEINVADGGVDAVWKASIGKLAASQRAEVATPSRKSSQILSSNITFA
jgi:hypothetical protein